MGASDWVSNSVAIIAIVISFFAWRTSRRYAKADYERVTENAQPRLWARATFSGVEVKNDSPDPAHDVVLSVTIDKGLRQWRFTDPVTIDRPAFVQFHQMFEATVTLGAPPRSADEGKIPLQLALHYKTQKGNVRLWEDEVYVYLGGGFPAVKDWRER